MNLLKTFILPVKNNEIKYNKINLTKEEINIEETYIPAPGLSKKTNNLFELSDQNIFLNYDVFGFIYWMLTRCEN